MDKTDSGKLSNTVSGDTLAGLYGFGGAVVDQTLSVFIGDRNGVDGHTLVLRTFLPSLHEAVQDDGEHDEDGQTQDGESNQNACGDTNVLPLTHAHTKPRRS